MEDAPLDLIETLSLKIHSGVRFSYIFPRDVVIPKGRRQLLLKFGWRDLISKGLVERRLLDDVKVTTIFKEKQACVLFPDLKGKPDLNVMFYGDHKEFREWY